MRSGLILLAVLGSFGLTGCSEDIGAAMKIETSTNEFQTLRGTFDGSLSLIQGKFQNATISMTNGKLTCNGTSNTGKASVGLGRLKITHTFEISCNDGRTGQVVIPVKSIGDGLTHLTASGAGSGTLSDGARIKVVLGDASEALSW